MTDGGGQFDETGAGESDGAGFRLTQDFGRPAVGPFAGVVVNRPIDQVLTYRVPARLDRIIQVGQRVRVPLGKGNKQATGYCVSVGDLAPEGLDPRKLKDVAEVLDPVPLIDAKMLELTRWLAEYYVCSWGQALESAVPAGVRNQAGTRVGTFLVVPAEIRQGLQDQTLK